MSTPRSRPWSWLLLLPLLAAVHLGMTGCSKEGKAAKHLSDADRHFANREFEKAKIEYINALRGQPTNGHAVLRLGKIFLAQGQFLEAMPMVAWSRQRFPDDIEIRESFIEILAVAAAGGNPTNRAKLGTEIEELLQRDPANQKAVLMLTDISKSPEETEALVRRVGELRAKAGERPVFKLVDAEIHRRKGDTNACEASIKAAVALAPEDPSIHGIYAGFLLASRRVAEGEAELRKGAELSPPYGILRERWGRYLLSERRYDEARAVLDEINAKAPERVGAWRTRAELAMDENKLEEADRLLARAIGQAPSDPENQRALARLRLAQKKPADAVKELEKVSQRLPGFPRTQFQLGLAYLMNRDTLKAEAALEEAVRLDPGLTDATLILAQLKLNRGEGDRATQMLRELLRREPRNERAHLQLIRTERAAGREDDAFASATAAVAKFPTNSAIVFQHGLLLRTRKQPEAARAAFEQYAKLSTNDLPAIEQLIAMDVDAKDLAGATKRIQARLDQTPNDPLAWLIKAEVLRIQGDRTQAEVALRKVLELDPDNEAAFLALSAHLNATGRQKEAVAQLEELIKVRPNDVRALLRVGEVRSLLGEYQLAREAYEKALKIRPELPGALNNLAELMAERFDQVEQARALAQKARQLDPESPYFADTLGWIEYRRNQYPEALRLISEAAGKLGEIPEIQYHLGMTHYMMGQEAPAKSALRLAVAATRDYKGKDVARDYLAMLEVDGGKADENAVRALENRRKEAPGDVIALARLGTAYELTGATEKAREAYEAALKINPQSVPVLGRLAGLYSQRLNDPAKALTLARTARGLAPNDPEVAVTLGRLAYAAGDQAWAYSLLQEGSRRLTNRPGATYDLALAAYSLGRTEEASRSMQALAGPGRDPEVGALAASFLEMTALAAAPSGAPESLAKIQKVLDADPTHPAALFAYGIAAEAQGQYPNARTAYERLLTRYPGFTPGLRQMTILSADRLGDDAKAQELGVKARQAYPRDDVLAAALGKAACRRGDFAYASQLLGEASRTRAMDAGIWYYLGVASQGLKKIPEAKTQLEKALALEPQASFAEDAKKRLEQLKGA